MAPKDVPWNDIDKCFATFDENGDGMLSVDEFVFVCEALFVDEKGQTVPLDNAKMNEAFLIFDSSNDGLIDREEFFFCWDQWIKAVLGMTEPADRRPELAYKLALELKNKK